MYPPSGPQPSPYFSDHATGLSGWQTAEITGLSGPETGPGWFFRGDGELVMVFGGQSPGLRLRAAISRDRGETWSAPVQTNIPDLRAGQSAGNLPDASAYIVHSPAVAR